MAINDIDVKRFKIWPTIARTSPLLVDLILLINCMVNPSFNSFYLLILGILAHLSNAFFKYAIMKPIYKLTGREALPFLGKGVRPNGAMSCGKVLNGKVATSFGMPSGHSQIIWTLGTYLLCRLVKNFIDKREKQSSKSVDILEYIWLVVSWLVILGGMTYVSYSRVYIEGCHTLEQVIVGGVTGATLGFLAFYLEDSIRNLIGI